MAKKPNYNFEKRQKDLARIKKKEEKLQKKALKKVETDFDPDAEPETDTEPAEGGPTPE